MQKMKMGMKNWYDQFLSEFEFHRLSDYPEKALKCRKSEEIAIEQKLDLS